MGRFDTLKPETQDMVKAMLPAIASSYNIDVDNFQDIIPEDIRMRQWDCERRDHIKDKPENDGRNWGVEFLKLLAAVARLNDGNLPLLQERLREKVEKHAEKHPWARLEDLRIVKAEFQNPALRDPKLPQPESSSDDSLDSYLEELVDQDLPRGMRGGNNEAYESRVQGWWKANQPKKPKKPVRLRRDENGGYQRRSKDKSKRKDRDISQFSEASNTPDLDNARDDSLAPEPKRRRLLSKRPSTKEESPTNLDVDSDDEELEAKTALAELEAAEAELEVKRKKQRALELKLEAKKAKAARAASASSGNTPVPTSRPNTTSFKGFSLLGDDDEHHGDEQVAHDVDGSGFSSLVGFNDRTQLRGFTGFGPSTGTTQFHGFNGFEDFSNFNNSPSPSAQANLPMRQGSQSLRHTDDENWEEEEVVEEFDEEADEEADEEVDEEDSEDSEDSEE